MPAPRPRIRPSPHPAGVNLRCTITPGSPLRRPAPVRLNAPPTDAARTPAPIRPTPAAESAACIGPKPPKLLGPSRPHKPPQTITIRHLDLIFPPSLDSPPIPEYLPSPADRNSPSRGCCSRRQGTFSQGNSTAPGFWALGEGTALPASAASPGISTSAIGAAEDGLCRIDLAHAARPPRTTRSPTSRRALPQSAPKGLEGTAGCPSRAAALPFSHRPLSESRQVPGEKVSKREGHPAVPPCPFGPTSFPQSAFGVSFPGARSLGNGAGGPSLARRPSQLPGWAARRRSTFVARQPQSVCASPTSQSPQAATPPDAKRRRCRTNLPRVSACAAGERRTEAKPKHLSASAAARGVRGNPGQVPTSSTPRPTIKETR